MIDLEKLRIDACTLGDLRLENGEFWNSQYIVQGILQFFIHMYV